MAPIKKKSLKNIFFEHLLGVRHCSKLRGLNTETYKSHPHPPRQEISALPALLFLVEVGVRDRHTERQMLTSDVEKNTGKRVVSEQQARLHENSNKVPATSQTETQKGLTHKHISSWLGKPPLTEKQVFCRGRRGHL